MTNLNLNHLKSRVSVFVRNLSCGGTGRFRYSEHCPEGLYASCYAAMTLHYIGELNLTETERNDWASYLNSWQNKETGYFIGPEIETDDDISGSHDREHLLLHLTATVLPVLDILLCKPKYPLNFSEKFLDATQLKIWLDARDLRNAWYEGNNLLFALQILIYFRDNHLDTRASAQVELMFNWLDKKIDPETGLWGTDGYCSHFVAMCGGYHQLLAYYYDKRKIASPARLIDTVLALQHPDGGFHPSGGGGACEDVDAIDILVNVYKLHDYRRPEIRVALRRALRHISRMEADSGGFVYRRNQPFCHMGMKKTDTPSGAGSVFATWFRTHTIALILEIIGPPVESNDRLKYNPTLSMGWHPISREWPQKLGFFARLAEAWTTGTVNYLKLLYQDETQKRLAWYKHKIKSLISG